MAAQVRETKPKLRQQSGNIYLFVPNLIGYARLVLMCISLYFMPLHPRSCALLYSVSQLLDALDGYAARYLNQSTRFGAVLDMVTDRCTTATLFVFLASAFPRWAIVFQGLIVLDMASHYIHMYATLAMGAGENKSHKAVDRSRSQLLHLYYTNKTVLFLCCFFNEAFFIALYLLSFSSPLMLGYSVKDTLALSQIMEEIPHSAGARELARANKIDSTVPWIIAGVSLPVMLLKQFINVVQLVKACNWIVEGDQKARGIQQESQPKKEL